MSVYYNNRPQEVPALEVGDKVYPIARNIRTTRPSRKLDHQKVGPFAVEKKVGPVSYKLRLSESMEKIHPIFHIAFLEKTNKTAKIATNIPRGNNTGQ